MKKTLLMLLVCCFSVALAQTDIKSSNKQAQKAFESAGRLLSLKQYFNAIEKLKEAVNSDPGFIGAYQQLADVQRMLRQYNDALLNYQKVLQLNPDFHSSTYFGIGETELKTGNYSAALSHLKKYASFSGLSEERKKLVSKYIVDCEFSIEAIKKPVAFDPKNLGKSVNTAASEYLPMLTADEENLIFTRRSNNNEDFYQSQKTNSGWEISKYLSANINTFNFNEGAQCITPDGMYLFFTGCNRPDGLGRCDIFVCRREGKEWSKPFNMGPPINSPGWESQPSISADGRTLYFISSRPGGLGGFDIWKTTLKKEGNWSDPVNLGPNINTPFDEESPFIHPDGKTLYFSSTGWPGLGGRDVFVSRIDNNGNWQKPKNLGYPINTYQDEGGLTVSANGKTAYFSSDKKNGFGEMDIYSFELDPILRPGLVTYVKGKIFDAKSNETLDAKITITNLETGQTDFDEITDATTGEFLATMLSGQKYALSVGRPGYLFYSENFSLDKVNLASQPFVLNVPLKRIEPGELVILKNIFFESNKYELLPESETELTQLLHFLNENPSMSIEISGHTDNIGENNLNQKLSQNRAETVYNYLIHHQISPSRLSFKGYGESQPVADNSTEEGRQKNRRTEFRIVKN